MHDKLVLDYNAAHIDTIMKLINLPHLSPKIKTFGYYRFYPDGRHIHLVNQQDWLVNRVKTFRRVGHVFETAAQEMKVGQELYNVWTVPEVDGIWELLQAYGIWNGYSILINQGDYVESWNFACSLEDTEMVNFFVNNLNMLKRTIRKFNKAARDILWPSEAVLGHFQQDVLNREKLGLGATTKDNRFYLSLDSLQKKVGLSEREVMCLYHLAHGCTYKEAAIKMSLSHRTVETFINRMKRKSDCNKSSLVKAFHCLSTMEKQKIKRMISSTEQKLFQVPGWGDKKIGLKRNARLA